MRAARLRTLAATAICCGAMMAGRAAIGADLASDVRALPEDTAPAKLKKAMLTWAVEEATACRAAGQGEKAASLEADIRDSLGRELAREMKPPEGLFPKIASLQTNPIAQGAIKAMKKIAAASTTYPKGPAGDVTHDDTGWRFIIITDDAKLLAQGLCDPQSPMRGDPSLVAPLMRRLSTTYEYMVPGHKRNADFGISDNAAEDYLLVRSVYPDLILPSLRKAWERAITVNTDAVLAKVGARFAAGVAGTAYPNADTRWCNALLFGSMVTGREDYRRAAEQGVRLQATAVYGDGGMAYIGLQNEAFTYHAINVVSLGRYWQVTGDATAREIIERTRWYYPLSIEPSGVAECYTAPAWKPYWNGVTGADAALVVANLTRCPQNARVAAMGAIKGTLQTAAFYPVGVEAAPAPDDYITYDQNILGPRGRFGTFSFGGTTRQAPAGRRGEIYDQSAENRGRSTYVGCMVVDGPGELPKGQSKDWPLDAALQDATCEVRTSAAEPDIWRLGTHAYLSREDHNAATVTARVAALTTTYRINTVTGKPVPWVVRQAWVMTPRRMVGLVEMQSDAPSQAYGIDGTLKLVSGRGSSGTRKEFAADGSGPGASSLRYGKLVTTFHAHDYASLATEYTDTFSGDAKKCGRILLLDHADQKRLKDYPSGTRRFYLVEIRPESSAPATGVARIPAEGGVFGFEFAEGASRYRLAFNPTGKPLAYRATLSGGGPATIHASGESYRAPWLPQLPTGPAPVPLPGAPVDVTLPAYSHILIESASTR